MPYPPQQHPYHPQPQTSIGPIGVPASGLPGPLGAPSVQQDAEGLPDEVSRRAVEPTEEEASTNELLETLLEALKAGNIAHAGNAISQLTKSEQEARSFAHCPALLRQAITALKLGLEARQAETDMTTLADMVFALGKLNINASDPVIMDLMKTVAEMSRYKADQFTPNIMSNLVWGFACLGIRNDSLMSVIAAEVVNKITSFDHRELSNTAWAFAKCGLWNQQLACCLVAECKEKIQTFTPQSLSNVSWAMAQWGTSEVELLDAICTEVKSKREHFEPAPLTMTAWAFATLQIRNDEIMAIISEESMAKMKLFRKQDLAHLAWAFASLRVQDRKLFDVMSAEIRKKMSGTLPPELANIAWAFAKNNLAMDDIMRELAAEAVLQIQGFKTAEIAMMTWAYAVAGQQNTLLMTEVGLQVARRMDKFTVAQLAHIAWAFGALSMKHRDFLVTLSRYAQSSMTQFKAQGLSNIAWSFAMVQWRDVEFLNAAVPCIRAGISELKPLALSRCAWAYRTLAVHHEVLLESIMEESLKKISDFSYKGLVKLVDSCFVGTPTKAQLALEQAVTDRVAEAAALMQSMWTSHASLGTYPQDCCKKLQSLGISDFGLKGTPLLLAKLGIKMPEFEFVHRCYQQVGDGLEFAAAGIEVELATDKAITLNKILVTHFDGQEIEAVMAFKGDAESFQVTMTQQEAKQLLVANIVTPTQESEALHQTLAQACALICSKLGIDASSEEQCEAVHGCIRTLLVAIPSLSSVALLLQMQMRFPKVRLEFVEFHASLGSWTSS